MRKVCRYVCREICLLVCPRVIFDEFYLFWKSVRNLNFRYINRKGFEVGYFWKYLKTMGFVFLNKIHQKILGSLYFRNFLNRGILIVFSWYIFSYSYLRMKYIVKNQKNNVCRPYYLSFGNYKCARFWSLKSKK